MVQPFTDEEGAGKNRERIERARKKEEVEFVVKDGVIDRVVEVKSRGGGKYERHRYLESHRDEIVADLVGLGRGGMIKKWHISSAGWYKLKQRWGVGIAKASCPAVAKSMAKLPKILPGISKREEKRTGVSTSVGVTGDEKTYKERYEELLGWVVWLRQTTDLILRQCG